MPRDKQRASERSLQGETVFEEGAKRKKKHFLKPGKVNTNGHFFLPFVFIKKKKMVRPETVNSETPLLKSFLKSRQ